MTDLTLLSEAQMRRIEPYVPLSHGIPRADDRRVMSGIVFVIRNGLRWRDAPPGHEAHRTLYKRFIRWSRMGVFNRIFAGLAAEGGRSTPIRHGKQLHRQRHKVEIMFGRLKDWRRSATWNDRCAQTFMSAIALSASMHALPVVYQFELLHSR